MTGWREPTDWVDRCGDPFDQVDILVGSMPVAVADVRSHPLLDHPPM